ncbi:glycosyltransferase family 2 protein [Pseudarthrobacter sp. PH31-O2]|uniref:glycosyltransferase family 2 protein n=1 Tax=Pseudarthrobacter sp. PH31-O2 TaxID=3046206 RepID=UPI0024BA11DE|nr:glycosyltransferase family 2 protein [Pseudarthrobacter sp. PH31-O2]MDJ0352034.1 glycosyltransferase family 2 protein [Pseudarthrobacter sp. PH31-O2]
MKRNGRPAVSVLMPVRNGSKTIQSAVRSTLAALPREGQLLVTDDGSTDGTPEILGRFRDSRLTVFRNEKSLGVAATLNALLWRAGTPYIGRMDADDLAMPFRFAAQRTHLGSDHEVTFTSVVNFGPRIGNWKPAIPIGITAEAMPYFLLLGNPLFHSAMYGSTETLRRMSGYIAGPAEDYELWMRLAASGYRLRRTAVPFTAYRHHQSQTTKEADWKRRVLDDPALRSSHRALAASVGWDGPDFFDAVVQGAHFTGEARLVAELSSFLDARCGHLSGTERRHLAHQLGKLTAKRGPS